MRGAHFAAILLLSAGALALGAGASVRAEEPASAAAPASQSAPAESAEPPAAAATGDAAEAPSAPVDPVVAIIRTKLADPAITKG